MFGRLQSRKRELMAGIGSLDVQECGRLDVEARVRRDSLGAELDTLLLQEEISWRQKSRALWLQEGDRNTSYFHALANAHRNYNSLNTISIEGRLSDDPKEIRVCAVFFSDFVSGQRLLETQT